MSNFRQILPSTSNVATADTDATASEAGQPYGGGDPSGSAAGKARRRRAPSHVSQNACTNCKKARAKVRIFLLSAIFLLPLTPFFSSSMNPSLAGG